MLNARPAVFGRSITTGRWKRKKERKSICIALFSIFVSAGTRDDGILPPVQPLVTDDVFLDSVDCSEGRIRREINHMKSNASAGPDGIPPILLRR